MRAAVALRDRREREREGRTLIDGARELSRALDAGVPIVEAFVAPERCDARCEPVRRRLAELDVPLVDVSTGVLGRIGFGDRLEGIVAVAQPVRQELARLQLPRDPLVVVLERVEKPGNIGAVLRSADATGVAAVIVADPATDLYNPNAIRASLGTIFAVPVRSAPSAEVLAWLRARRLAILTARVDGAVDYTEPDLRRPTALVLGSEAQGLSMAWDDADVQGIRLPMLGVADSLNVSITAAVLCYEALRQRRSPQG